jgi:hypothetical protein
MGLYFYGNGLKIHLFAALRSGLLHVQYIAIKAAFQVVLRVQYYRYYFLRSSI